MGLAGGVVREPGIDFGGWGDRSCVIMPFTCWGLAWCVELSNVCHDEVGVFLAVFE